MVRLPRGWVLHQPAGSQYAAGAAQRRIPRPPDHLYNRPVTVDLGNDGVAPQITLQGTTTQTVNSPGLFTTYATTPVQPGGGTMTVNWTVTLAGTLAAGDANNVRLVYSVAGGPGIFLAQSVNAAAAGTYPQAPVTFNFPPNSAVQLSVAPNAGTAGSVYGGTVTVPGFGQAFVGPSGGGDAWALDQCFLSTSVGPLDTAICTVFAGPLPLPQYAVTGSLAGGAAQFGLGGVGFSFGWFIYAVWTGGTAGSFAYLRVTGSKTVLAQS